MRISVISAIRYGMLAQAGDYGSSKVMIVQIASERHNGVTKYVSERYESNSNRVAQRG
jgi:hypothetical protein